MDITILPGKLSGEISAIPSKSMSHRLLICAALSDKPTELLCTQTSRDMDATADCLNALGAEILRTDTGYHVEPIRKIPACATLNCCESGSTLRFLLPVAAALGVESTFLLEGRLPQRPLSPLWEEMERMGCSLTRPTPNTILCQGHLQPGEYTIPGNISSQFITGLLLALPLLHGNSTINITGKLESRPYVDLTKQAMGKFGVSADTTFISGNHTYRSPGFLRVECDWSNAAFFLAAQALGCDLHIRDLDHDSVQGDRAVMTLLPGLRDNITVSAADIPDLVPILSVFAACQQGAVFTDVQRLRIKESDRVASTIALIKNLGGQAEATETTLTVYGTGLTGGTIDAMNDHRIAMSAAIASVRCTEPVTILGAQCVKKSYPTFWEEFSRLGGTYEQYLR